MSKISFVFSFFIIVLSTFMLTRSTETAYIGVEYNFIAIQYIFSALPIICLCVTLRERTNNVFTNNNICRLVRYKSKRIVLLKELKKILIYVVVFQFVESLTIAMFTFNLRGFDFTNIVVYSILNILIKYLFMVIQFAGEIYSSNSFSFIVTAVVYLCLMFSGWLVNESIKKHHTEELVVSVLEFIQKINIVNYMSLERVNLSINQLCFFVLVILFVIFLVMFGIRNKVKGIDVLERG
ncbi:MAG: hypothetical protein UGF89_00100 [Acutalibacteraceae bacterium]|nr:hypothetical protein [Acutalibacteraceae bacterium]